MSIRLKLGITYIVCVILSATVIVFAIFSGVGRYMEAMVDAIVEDSSVKELVEESINILAELRQKELYEPETLLDPEFQATINASLEPYNGGLIVYYDGEYMSPLDIPLDKVEAFFEENLLEEDEDARTVYTFGNQNNEIHSFEVEDQTYRYAGYDINYYDETLTYYFIMNITSVNNFNDTVRNGAGIAVMMLILLMSLPVMLMIQFNIIRPLKKLEQGADEIGKGNLNFEITSKNRDEVGRVLRSYEKMRVELKNSIDKQVKYENNRKELISSISHDLKTPITSIKGYVEGIMDGVANTPEKQERYLKVIHQKSLDMDKMIDDLFTFSKLDLNKLPFDFHKVNMETFIRDYVDGAIMEFDSADIEFTYQNNALDNPFVMADTQQIRRVLQNLIHNSLKYNTKDVKKVNVLLTNEKEKIGITIKDNGIGMTEDELSHAFEIFYRSDDSRNSKTGGSGLGLAIVKHIVVEHKGHIVAKSKPGMGTSITVELDKINGGNNGGEK